MTTIRELEKDCIPEVVAVILICRVFLKTATAGELTSFIDTHNLNWELFYKIVRAHRIRPIVNSVITTLKINEPTSSKLKADCRQIALNNFEHYRELLRLNNLFKIAGIVAVPYKGCLYGLQFYNDVSLREFSDLDFLINPGSKEVDAIATIMQKEGYTPASDTPEEFREFRINHIREYKFVLYVNGQRKFLAEFHSSLNDPAFETASPIANEYLFRDLHEETLSGSKIRVLSPAGHFIAMLTHHGIREQWTTLKNVMDLAMAIKSGDMVDWETVYECSAAYKFNKVLATGLTIAEDILGVRPGKPYQKVKAITPWLKKLLAKHPQPTDRTWRYNFILKLKSKDTTSDKYKMLYRHISYLTTPSILDYKFIKLPRALFFLYVVIKPVRMMWGRGK